MDGNVKLAARMTVRAGRIVYDPTGLSMVDWQKARPRYYVIPVLADGVASRADDYPR